MDVPKGEELIIQKFENRDSKEAVTFGTSVCIVSATGFFLSFNSSGDVKFDKHQGYVLGSVEWGSRFQSRYWWRWY